MGCLDTAERRVRLASEAVTWWIYCFSTASRCLRALVKNEVLITVVLLHCFVTLCFALLIVLQPIFLTSPDLISYSLIALETKFGTQQKLQEFWQIYRRNWARNTLWTDVTFEWTKSTLHRLLATYLLTFPCLSVQAWFCFSIDWYGNIAEFPITGNDKVWTIKRVHK